MVRFGRHVRGSRGQGHATDSHGRFLWTFFFFLTSLRFPLLFFRSHNPHCYFRPERQTKVQGTDRTGNSTSEPTCPPVPCKMRSPGRCTHLPPSASPRRASPRGTERASVHSTPHTRPWHSRLRRLIELRRFIEVEKEREERQEKEVEKQKNEN